VQKIFDPIHFGFEFTADWYAFDHKAAHKAALKARNAEAKALRAEGRKVTCFTLPNSLRTMGGIGSGKPQIELLVTAYGFNAD
jgi:hypothetical protein